MQPSNSFAYAIPGLKFKDITFEQRRDTELPNRIIKTVCDYYGVKLKSLQSISRIQHLVLARSVIMALLRSKTNLSLQRIAGIFNRHHTTVIYAEENIKIMRDRNYEFNKQYIHIEYMIE